VGGLERESYACPTLVGMPQFSTIFLILPLCKNFLTL
jgi:hypothetical protein